MAMRKYDVIIAYLAKTRERIIFGAEKQRAGEITEVQGSFICARKLVVNR